MNDQRFDKSAFHSNRESEFDNLPMLPFVPQDAHMVYELNRYSGTPKKYRARISDIFSSPASSPIIVAADASDNGYYMLCAPVDTVQRYGILDFILEMYSNDDVSKKRKDMYHIKIIVMRDTEMTSEGSSPLASLSYQRQYNHEIPVIQILYRTGHDRYFHLYTHFQIFPCEQFRVPHY